MCMGAILQHLHTTTVTCAELWPRTTEGMNDSLLCTKKRITLVALLQSTVFDVGYPKFIRSHSSHLHCNVQVIGCIFTASIFSFQKL